MLILNNFVYYFIYASSVLIYGIGLSKVSLLSVRHDHILISMFKMLCSVISTATLVYLVNVYILVPAHLSELYPLVTVLFFSAIAVFFESIIRITAKISTTDFSISILCILVGVGESLSLSECILNSSLCVLSFFFMIPILYSIRKRIEIVRPSDDFEGISLLLVSIALIIIIFMFAGVSWLNKGVFPWS